MAGHMILQHVLSWCIRLLICRYDISSDYNMNAATVFMKESLLINANTYLAFIDCPEPNCDAQQLNGADAEIHSKVYLNLDEYAYTSKRCGTMYFRNRPDNGDGGKMPIAVFNCIMQEVFDTWDLKNRTYGILIEQNKVTYLWFAKEILIFTSSVDTLQDIVTELQQEDKYAGLKLSEELYITYMQLVEVPAIDNGISYEEDTFYLEQFFVQRDNETGEIKKKIHVTLEKFWSLQYEPRTKQMKKIGPSQDDEGMNCGQYGCTEVYKVDEVIHHFEMSLLEIHTVEKINSPFLKKLKGCGDFGSRKLIGQVRRSTYTNEMVTIWTPEFGKQKSFERGPEVDEDIIEAEMNTYTFTKAKEKCEE